MQAIFRIFRKLLTCCVLTWSLLPVAWADEVPTSTTTPDSTAVSAPPVAAGDELVAKALSALEQQPSVVAKLRERIDLFGEQLIGSGTYIQGPADEHLFRLELRLQGASQGTTLQHVSNGTTLWIFRELDGKDGRVSKVNLATVLAALDRAGQGGATGLTGLGLGGLPKLLAGLARDLQFDAPEQSSLGSLPVLVLKGTWRPARLRALLPEQHEALDRGEAPDIRKLAPHVPEQVTLTLGRDDLFPYRVEFLRREPPGILSREPGDLQAIVLLEVFDVKFGAPIERAKFTYQPDPEQVVPDDTDHYLRSLGL